MASPNAVVFAAVNPSESASLHGHKAKTPIIAGAVSGACVGLAWIIGLVTYIYKRQRRSARARSKGLKSHRDLEEPLAVVDSKYIIPPDPAVPHGPQVTEKAAGSKELGRDPGLFEENGTCGVEPVDSHTTEAGPQASGGASLRKASEGVCGESSIELEDSAPTGGTQSAAHI
ncbi:hypothetical protein OE88DRAFT_1655823 [Heliocybe sulcata]|uniref:Uncharacterized protein n=1 Tax=Heliocybe sulcata TaxID=5364 RepID=A0A5C3N8E6_9AGAM|nr:hypothetical protein OE88DRAFT_1655823 [Heliocybe sulcata]